MKLKDAFLSLEKYFSPGIIGQANDQYIKVVKMKGQEVPWHNHENKDELFYIVKGTLLMEIENRPDLILKKGDLFVSMYKENLVFDENKYRTPVYYEALALILKAGMGYSENKKGQSHNNLTLSSSVASTGIEPVSKV